MQANSLPSEPPGKPGVGIRVRSYLGTVVGDGEEEAGLAGKGIPSKRKAYPRHEGRGETAWSQWETARSLVKDVKWTSALSQLAFLFHAKETE